MRLAGQVLGDHRTVLRLHAHRQDLLPFVLLDVAGDAGDGAAGADAGDEHVDRAIGILPDLGAGGLDSGSPDWPDS